MDKLQKFEFELKKSRMIEDFFRTHPKFPFLDLGYDITDHVLLRFFWLEMVKPYINYFDDKWEHYTLRLGPYTNFRDYDGISSEVILDFYGIQSKRCFSISPIGHLQDKLNSRPSYIYVNTDIDNHLADVLEEPELELYFLAMGVDLRMPNIMSVVRDFLHAFFIEQLPLKEMTKKVDKFDLTDRKKYLRRK